MKPYQIYYFHDDFTKPIILYEFNKNKEAIQFCDECDKRHTRQTNFESNGKYYVGEYITKDTMRFITSRFKIIEQWKESNSQSICFWVDQEAYGDRQYFFNNITQQFSRKFISIGD